MSASQWARQAAEYALRLLTERAGLPARAADAVVHYGHDGERQTGAVCVCITPSGFFGEETYGTHASLPVLPLREVEGVPLLYGTPDLERHGDRLVVHADIVASTYFLVTRYEEMVRRDARDEHGRFPGRQSLPCRAGFIHRPIVEEYAALLGKWLRMAGVAVPESRREFTLLLTHDVDSLRKYSNPLRTAGSVLLGHRPARNIVSPLASLLGFVRDPCDNFKEISAIDSSAPAPSRSVYFVKGGGKGRHDRRYEPRDRSVQELARQIVASGAEIGLHTSYEGGLHPDRIVVEKAALEDAVGLPIRGNRHHYLAWREIEDGWALKNAGITWDSTLGYAGVAGFRLGVCHPIPLFDPVSLQPMGIIEHPLIVMDATLVEPAYMALDEQGARAQCRQLLRETRKHGGEFVVLWHNVPFERRPSIYLGRLYDALVTGRIEQDE